jgi:hypothetical protein
MTDFIVITKSSGRVGVRDVVSAGMQSRMVPRNRGVYGCRRRDLLASPLGSCPGEQLAAVRKGFRPSCVGEFRNEFCQIEQIVEYLQRTQLCRY